MSFSGKTAVITGGASGIGRAIGAELVRRGAEVVLADIQHEMAEAAAKEMGAKARAVHVDVRDYAAVERLFADVPRIDYVLNNAGSGIFGEAHLYEARDWDFSIDLNIRGVVNVVRASYPRMIAQGHGHIVNTASVAGLMTTPFLSAYAMTKHAVVGLSKAMRVEGARYGVRVSALCPGAIRTPLLGGGAHGRTVYDLPPARMLEWWERMRPMDVDVFARKTVDEIAKNTPIIVLPKANRSFLRLFKFFPWMEEKIATKLYEKTFADFPEVARGKKQTNGAHAPHATTQ
jgi:NAD(P)-dependent dehydrogenase (short-subunit alcohol dehydrogenase family)